MNEDILLAGDTPFYERKTDSMTKKAEGRDARVFTKLQ